MLTKKQMARLKDHAKKHKGGMRGKHMRNMAKFVKDGDTFSSAHKKAVKLDGHDPFVEKKARKECLKKEAKKDRRVPRANVPSYDDIGVKSKKEHPVFKNMKKKKKKC